MKRWSDSYGTATFTLTMQAQKLIKQLLEIDLSHAKDGLERAQHQKKKDATWKSGQGATIDEVILGYQDWIKRTEAVLEELQ